MTKNDKQYRSYSYFFDTAISQLILMIQKTSWIKFCWTYPGFKGRSVIRPSSFRYKAIWWPYNGTYGLITDTRPWPYISRSTRFFKTPKGLVSDIWPWPYNRGNTVETLYGIFIHTGSFFCYLLSFIYPPARNFHPFSSCNPHFLREILRIRMRYR